MYYYTKSEAEKIVSLLGKEKVTLNISEMQCQNSGHFITFNDHKQLGYLVHIRLTNGDIVYPHNLLGEKFKASYK